MFSTFAFICVFYFLYVSIGDEKDVQGLTLEITKDVESFRNSSLVTGARVSISHSPGRLTEWKKEQVKIMMMKLLNYVSFCRSQPTKSLFIRKRPCLGVGEGVMVISVKTRLFMRIFNYRPQL